MESTLFFHTTAQHYINIGVLSEELIHTVDCVIFTNATPVAQLLRFNAFARDHKPNPIQFIYISIHGASFNVFTDRGAIMDNNINGQSCVTGSLPFSSTVVTEPNLIVVCSIEEGVAAEGKAWKVATETGRTARI